MLLNYGQERSQAFVLLSTREQGGGVGLWGGGGQLWLVFPKCFHVDDRESQLRTLPVFSNNNMCHKPVNELPGIKKKKKSTLFLFSCPTFQGNCSSETHSSSDQRYPKAAYVGFMEISREFGNFI